MYLDDEHQEHKGRIQEELTPVDTYELYDQMLDETHDCDCHLCVEYSRNLEEIDPVMYRCGYTDFLDSLSDQYYEIDDEYYEINEVNEVIEAIEEEIEEEEL